MSARGKIDKILIANRGEIAVRIMRSAQELGLKVVAIYEETDKDAFHIMRADEAVCIGPGPRKDYLNIDKIIEAAKRDRGPGHPPGLRLSGGKSRLPRSLHQCGPGVHRAAPGGDPQPGEQGHRPQNRPGDRHPGDSRHRQPAPGGPGGEAGPGVRGDPRLSPDDQGGFGRRRPGDSPGGG